MKLLNNRRIAWVVLILCALGSIVGFGGGCLVRQRKDALNVFYNGVDSSFAVRFSMDAYLENCAVYARTMAEEYRLHIDMKSDTAAHVLDLAALVGAGDLDERAERYVQLCALVESLYTEFSAASLNEKDRELFKNAYTNFQGEVSKLKYDEYHSIAADFNQSCECFPAGIICRLLGIELLNPF